jgi:predicted nucleotidyltransferase
MTRDALLQRLRELKPWMTSRGVTRLRVFGSYARDEATADSDVDLVADFAGQPSLLELIGIERELAEKLGVRVDLATTAGLKPRVRAWVDAEALDA